MPDKKYLIEIPGMPEGSGVWDSDKWERNKDAFMSDYPEANVFELGEYDAGDTNENDQIMLTFENDPDSSGVWDSAKWERNKEAFTADHPEAKVNRVRYVDYWGNAAQENRAKREELSRPDAERDARLADLGYYDDMSGQQKDFSLENNTIGLKPVSSAIEQNSVSGETTYHDPKLAEFYANDSAHTERMAEIARLDAEYDNNPSVVAQREWGQKERAEQEKFIDDSLASIREDMNAEVNALEAGKGAFYKTASGQGMGDAAIIQQAMEFMRGKDAGQAYVENEKLETYASAAKLFEKAKQAYDVAGKGFWGAAADVGMDKLRDLATQSDIEAYNQIGDILTRLETRLGSLDEVTDNDIESNLSKEEQALIKGFLAYNEAMSNAQQDMSQAYKGGKIFGESISFMLEFLATGGLAGGTGKAAGNAVGKGLVKWAAKAAKGTAQRAARTVVTKAARALTSAAVGTLARTVAAPGTYQRMAEDSVKIEDGHLNRAKNAFEAFADSYIENLSEISGGVIGKSLKMAGVNPSKILGGMSFGKVGKMLADNSVMQAIAKGGKALFGENGVLKKFGFNGIFEEVEEEYIGNLIRELTIQPGALEEMHKDGNFGAMLIGFAPMTIFGAGMSAASIGAKNIEAADLGKKLRENLSSHYTDEQIDHMMNLVSGAENAKQVWDAIKPLTAGLTAEETQQLYQYGAFMAQNKAMLFAKKAEEDNLAQAKRAEAEHTYGKFWQENAEGAESVQLATLNDGRNVFVLSEPTADGVVSIIDAKTGEKGFTNVSNYKTQEVNGEVSPMTQKWSMDAYLEGSIAADRMTAEQARMTREYDEQVKNLQSQIQEGTQINLGTEGSPVILLATGKFVKDGVVAVDQTGNTHTVGWNQVADAMGQPIIVKTDQQIVDEEIAGIVARNAERRKKMGNATPAMTEAVNESAAQTSETVAQETKHIPLNEDGTVNEAAFWEQDPEGYAQWNDEQNQDGGADTIQQIEAAKTELTAMLNEAQQATLTSNPANRKAAKREVGRLAERLARLEALEQSYADRALAPLRERAKMWADLTGAPVHVLETEEELAAISSSAASENAKQGSRVRGFAKDGRAYIFLPGIKDIEEIDEVFFHEAVAHNGLKGLLGKENYDRLCEQVWNMMSQAARNQFIRYPGVNGDYLAAADEYIAHIAEKMGAGIAEAEEKTIWQKIVDFVRSILREMGIELNVTEQELSDLLHQAYADLADNMAKAEQIATGEAMSAVEEAPSEARQQYDALLEDLTPEEIEAVVQNDFNAAQEAYNAHLANAPKVEPGESSKAYIERKKAYNDELKRLEAELDAQQTLMDEITAIKAANAPVLTDVEILEQDGFGVDTQNDDVRMSVRYTPTDEQKEAIINSIVNVTGRSREEAERWLASETSLAAMINDDLQYLDYVADPKYKAIKDNSDYPQGTVDFNNICRKRVPFTQMFTRLQRTFPNRVFNADELADIRTIMSKDGLTVACGLCYVEDRRQMVGEVAQSFIDGIQEGFETYANNPTKQKNAEKFMALIGEDTYVPQVYDLTTQEGLDKLYNEHRGIWEAFQAFNNARGQQPQNLLQGYAEYKREILSWSDKKVKQVNDNGGLRIFSYSDFEAHHLIDVVQIIIDCASKGVKIQGYTKVPAFARAVANTGIKLNRSLIPLGDTGLVDGQLAFDPVEGIDINDPDFLESNDNVGNILIGINDEQIRVAMNDPRIHYIIPYHARQKENIRQKLNVGAWTNYISTQNERNISDGKRVKDNINIYTDILTEDIATDRQFVEKYLQLCAEQGRIPKFDQFLDKDAEGNHVYTPGYYKFLIDFKLFDENGNILPQQPVVAEFDDAFNMQILENYAKDERESTGEQMNETYDKIVDALGLDESAAEGEDVRFSKKTKAPETAVQPMAGHSTVVSSADGANVIKNLETLLEEYRNKPSNRQKTFIGDLARALGLRNNGNHSNYGTFEAVNGEVFTYRISDHNSSTKNMEDAGNPNGISIVITHKPNSKITKDGNAHIVEFYYNTQKLLNADGRPYADIIQSVIQSLYSGEYKDTTGLAEMEEAVLFSVITPQMDADYLAAVERGDMKTAQRMVLEAAKLAMPNTKVVDKKGNPAVVYHGTKGKFNTFAYSREDIGFHFGTKGTARTRIGRGKDARIMQVFLNLENPLIFDTDLGSWDADYIVKDLLKKEMMSYDDAKAILLTPNGYKRNSVSALVDLRQWMSNNGYDGIVYPNWYESDGKDSYIAFNGNQIKSADPVAYDDAGNVIPLSERFNPEKKDIRFSARTDEQRQALFDKAKAQFGLTNNFNAAGYMLPDGSLLDFSEANNGGNPNQRSLDHREIEGIIMNEGIEYDSRWMYLADFMNEGAIRLLPEYAGINLMKAPTKEQRQKLFDFIYKYNGEVILEIADERLNNVAYVEYDSRTSPSRIFRDIDGYFNDGIVPQQDVRFSIANENQAIFVSNAAKAVENIKQEKATPEQWLKMIEKNGGLKAGEDKWMGLSDWLKASDKKTLTKAEVLDYINENMIVIEEQHYSNAEAYKNNSVRMDEQYPGWEDAFSFEWDDYRDSPSASILDESEAVALYNAHNEDQVEVDDDGDIVDDTDRNKVILWGEDIAKVLFGLDGNAVRPINETRELYTTKGLVNKREIALTIPTIEPWNKRDVTHFGDAGNGRAIAWIRFGETSYKTVSEDSAAYNESIDALYAYWDYLREKYGNGWADAMTEAEKAEEKRIQDKYKIKRANLRKKVLVIDEIQSKRHQEGREKGYKKDSNSPAAREIKRYFISTRDAYNAYQDQMAEKYGNDFENAFSEADFREILTNEEFTNLRNLKNEWEAASLSYGPYKGGIPDAPFDKNWHELAMKRMLRYAAENGYDVIAWTTGDQQADRYNIGGIVDAIDVADVAKGRFVYLSMEGGNIIKFIVNSEGEVIDGNSDYKGRQLSDIVGKELSLKILNAENGATLSGNDLRIGGEGMKGFYDKMLPAFMNKYGKKWGVKVEDINLSHLRSGLTMHSVPVTEEMKASVTEGQVMFSVRTANQTAQEFHNDVLTDFRRQFNLIQPTTVVDVNDRAALAEALGFTPEEFADEMYQQIVDGVNDGGQSLYEESRKRIAIFAIDSLRRSADVEENIFHENVRGLIAMHPELLELGEWLWENSGPKARRDIKEEIISSGYYEGQYHNEMLARYAGLVLAKGMAGAVMRKLPAEQQKHWKLILNKFGYEPERQDGNRRRRFESDTRRLGESGNGQKRPQEVPDNGSSARAQLGAEERRIINRLFPGTFGDQMEFAKQDVNINPSEAQKKAGNYKMGHLRLDGYNITIENPKGSVRRGTDSKGNEWENTLNNDYGYIRGTEGVDGDHIDVYLSDNPAEGKVFVIDQVNPETREFDEHKVMYGFSSMDEAREAYLANFSEGWNGLGTITEVTKDEFRKWIDSSHRKTKPFSEYKSVKTDILDEGDIRYSLVTDPALLERLDSEPTVKVYRAMQLIDGKLYPPMSAKVDGRMREPIELGKWEQAEERPDLADEKGYFKLDKGNRTSIKARYNPYFHTSPTPLNDQFSSAQTRPELVTVEVEVPESELTSGYKAEKAKDSVGKMEWKAGVVQSRLSGTRTVILSRWDKPVRIVPDSEVADVIVKMFEGKDITMPSNVVTPSLRAELESRGVPFVETDNQGKPVEVDTRYSVLSTPTDKVVAEGMRLSLQDFAQLAGNIFEAMPESFRKEAIEETFRNGMDMQSAIFQIPARLAEKTEWTDEDKDLAGIIREKVQDAVDESGAVSDRPLTTKEALWMLYRSTAANGNDLISAARRSLAAHNLGFDPGSERIREMADDHIRYSVVRNNMIDSATDMYNYEASLWTNRLKESWLDMNQSVISLQNALAEASGKPIESWEDVVLALNQLPSKSYADKKKYMRDFLEPLWDVVLKITKATDYRIEDIERYMMLKHALERNLAFAKRDAREYYETAFRQSIAAIEGNESLSDADKQKQIDKAQKTLDKHLTDIDAGTDAKFLEFREKDYGGLTSMFTYFDRSAVGKRSSYKSEESYQQAVIAATRPRYDNVADMEDAAKDEVDVMENDLAGLAAELWDKINAATKEVLRHQHASGMITTEQYNAVRNMFQHYVPLRGFADNTAEDMYSYYMSNSSNGFAVPIMGAKGRKTKAESPLGWIGTMAESAIQADNKNDAKLRLYYALLNRPDTGVLSIAETWYEYTGQNDANGRKIFAPVYPPATGKAMTADELRQHMDTWESSMMQKQAAGNAFKGNQSVNLRGSVVFQDTKEDKEHIIRVKVAGKDYSILVNGNPRAAQAINGLLNPDANVGPIEEWIGSLRRNMSALMTSFSPLFWVSNYQRDLLSSFMRTSESEGWKQAFKYLNNRRKAWRVASYIYKNDKGRLGNSYYENLYKEFAENGGITGYTSLTTNKEYEKLLEDYAKLADKPTRKWIKNAWNNFMGFGEAIEQVSRFAAYITAKEAGKSIEEAVNAAKEVSVNFNRKGSAKPLSLDEIDKLRTKDGKPLNMAQKAVAIVLTAMPKAMKELYFFFNASIQALSSSAKLAKQSPGKATAWAGMYMGLSMALAAINYLISGDDDEEEYLDLPDYVRRSNALVKISDEYYLKWSLPQEMRPFYATADIILGKAAGNMPHENVGKEIALAMAEWLPVNPFGTEDPILSLVPDVAAPYVEAKTNKNFVGGKIYDDMAFKSEGEKENIPAFRKATSKTGKVYVDVAEVLNAISGGDEVQKGAININPAVVEHLVEGYGGGLYDFAKMMVSFPAMLLSDEDLEVREIPFVNKVIMSVDETNMYTHTNEVFFHYRGIAENAERIEKEYRNSDDPSRADAYRQEEDWRIHQLFEQYDAELEEIKDRLKNAADKEEEDLLRQEQNAVRELLLNDIATGKEPDPVMALNDAVKEISKEISAIKKPFNDAEKKRKKAKESGDMEGAQKAKKERDEIRKSDAYKTADKAGKDLKELRDLLDEIKSTSLPEDRDSLIAKFNNDYQALKKKLESK